MILDLFIKPNITTIVKEIQIKSNILTFELNLLGILAFYKSARITETNYSWQLTIIIYTLFFVIYPFSQ